jgi:hypothetical protein
MLLESVKTYIKNFSNILLFFSVNLAIVISYWLFDHNSIMFISGIYAFLVHMMLLIMFRNSVVINDGNRVKIVGLLRYIKDNYKKIIKFLIIYFFISIIVSVIHYVLDGLLEHHYGMHKKSPLSILINKSFFHLQNLILCSVIFLSLSSNISILKTFTKSLNLLKKNFVAFTLIFFVAVLTPYLIVNIVAVIIKLFITPDPSEFVEIWIHFISPVLSLVLDAEISPGTFFAGAHMIGYDLKFIFSLPFYILLINIFNKKKL